jgi:hypothetical protein
MTEDGLLLCSHSLLSKWGFRDGDMPDELMDYCEEHGVDPCRADWRDTLCLLVRTHLLPELLKHQTVELADVGDTNHNPARAGRVNGADVTDLWTEGCDIVLLPEYVVVPYADVLAAMEQVANLS